MKTLHYIGTDCLAFSIIIPAQIHLVFFLFSSHYPRISLRFVAQENPGLKTQNATEHKWKRNPWKQNACRKNLQNSKENLHYYTIFPPPTSCRGISQNNPTSLSSPFQLSKVLFQAAQMNHSEKEFHNSCLQQMTHCSSSQDVKEVLMEVTLQILAVLHINHLF